ncbi:MAG TPA: hypothetical protein VMV48_12230 [Gallionellaceae bacterium]|nr:hypothetical protein [Gallionellaceae bacterium]
MQNQILLLRDSALLQYCQSIGNPIPVSLSLIRKDRSEKNKNPLGIPFRNIGGGVFYNPAEVLNFFSGQPVVHPTAKPLKRNSGLKRGKPGKEETIEARKRGITVPELRAQKVGAAC